MTTQKTHLLPTLFLILLLAACGNGPLTFRGGHYEGETSDSLPDGYGTWKAADGTEYSGFWSKGQFNGNGTLTHGDTVYCGHFVSGKRSGYGMLTIGDSTAYTGQWAKGVRQGKGQCTDSLGRSILATWNADTLVSGTRTDSLGTYCGQLAVDGTACGHGSYESADGTYYEGHWTADRRHLWGFSSSTSKRLRAGEWQADRYLGERVVYSSDRVYGIDVSKYQHVIGRKRYGIDWSRLRITHLGTISKKKVNGTVDFPVSFVYIKSTEGSSLPNTYYASDYAQARKHGLRVGSYHFFSHTSGAAEQARFFLRHSHFSKGDFPPVLDVEPTAEQIEKMGGVSSMFSRIQTWLNIVEQQTGVRPILYVGQSFVNKYLPSAPYIKKHYMVWIARYGEYKPDVQLVYWQLCPDGRVSGIHGEVDINVFDGYRTQFAEYCEQHSFK